MSKRGETPGRYSNGDVNSTRQGERRLSLPDFDTLREMAKHDPEGLEQLRLQLCQRVIDNAPAHAKPRLKGLMFQIESRRRLAANELEACEDVSRMMHDSLKRMQAMLKDLRAMQSESIMLSSKHFSPASEERPKAKVLPFRRSF